VAEQIQHVFPGQHATSRLSGRTETNQKQTSVLNASQLNSCKCHWQSELGPTMMLVRIFAGSDSEGYSIVRLERSPTGIISPVVRHITVPNGVNQGINSIEPDRTRI